MKHLFVIRQARPILDRAESAKFKSLFACAAVTCAFAGLFAAASSSAQVTIDSKTGAVKNEQTGSQ